MKILLNVLSAVAGGSITYLRNILAPLASSFEANREHELHILIHSSQTAALPQAAAMELHIVDGDMLRSYHRLWWEMRNIEEYAVDMDVYFVPYQVGYAPPNLRTVLMLRNMEPFFHWQYPYDPLTRLRNETLKQMSWRHLRRAHRVIAVSSFVKNYLENRVGLPPAKLVTVQHGCNAVFRSAPTPADREFLTKIGVHGEYIFTSGSLLPYRRLEDIIAAFARVSSCNLQLVVAGAHLNNGYVAKIVAMIQAYGVAGQVILTGNVSAEIMAALYRRCLLFVSASEIEACPNTIIEALSSGCAIITSTLPPSREFVGDSGLYYEPRNVEALAELMKSVCADSELRERLKSAARAASIPFTWDRCAEETYKALTSW